jgi:tetratricopeptide (TPR) repeat protein
VHGFHIKVESAMAIRRADQAEWSLVPRISRIVDLGYDQALADIYWLAFVQYVGNSEGRRLDGYKDAERFIDLIVDLDPSLVQTYYFAAFIIGSECKQPQRAAEIIETGIKSNPDNWCLPFIAGINQFLYAQNEVAAAKYYRQAAQLPGAPKWMLRQSDILAAKIPSVLKELNVWDSIYRSSNDDVIRSRARDRLITLWLRVYKTSPTGVVRTKAIEQLRDLGVNDVPY